MPAFLPSELPVVDRVRHHWVVLLRPPGWMLGGMLLVFVIAAIGRPWPMLALLVVALGLVGFFRWQTWHAESIILTRRRIVRISGVPETTSAEASLRLDRVSGAVLVQTPLGKILNYADLELEAPGDHPDVRVLKKLATPDRFYTSLRALIFAPHARPDPNEGLPFTGGPIGGPPGDGPAAVGAGVPGPVIDDEYVTEPLPNLGGPGGR